MENGGALGVGRPLVPEDTVEYHLYPEECSLELLSRLAVEWSSYALAFTAGHIWHYEPFRLAVSGRRDSQSRVCLIDLFIYLANDWYFKIAVNAFPFVIF